ncbi:Exodeoxyribonuclease 7 large subunit [Nitrospira sp. KM1]|uniref:exodeoxyribonuclease VII large subunit n=1 Tax=Nitrospira sp. KM1 TaxID=1936990 RepID=UPI0013A741A2|nr:exodeoxyribonuclease VII large subunit [Nitrospira sp. KM1]BCA54725.1 Exodeoxyribonuclease 7 large subunit [Nitrospira sp. KM1]
MPASALQPALPGYTAPILTVSELTRLIRASVESSFRDIWLEGEVSNLRVPNSGHLYFTLKDAASQIRAVLFKSDAARLRFSLAEGMHIVVRGRLTVYEQRGEYQLVIDAVEPRGIGALQVAFEQLKARLAAEGLFDHRKKKPLPVFPKTVGVVTSLSGAAIKDILAVLRRRWSSIHIVIAPVPVQGAAAATCIVEAIQALNELETPEVLIVGRGGGSLEDLWAFNEEIVVRAIAGSRIPVVSAIGHEIDVTLSDFAADYRAPTPSAAAESIVPVRTEVMARVRDLRTRMTHCVNQHCRVERRRLEGSQRGLWLGRYLVQEQAQRLDLLTMNLHDVMRAGVSVRLRDVMQSQQELRSRGPILMVKRGLSTLPQCVKRLERQMRVMLDQKRQSVHARASQLHHLSPLSVIGRGYSLLRLVPSRQLIKNIRHVQAGDQIEAHLADGHLRCTIDEVCQTAGLNSVVR